EGDGLRGGRARLAGGARRGRPPVPRGLSERGRAGRPARLPREASSGMEGPLSTPPGSAERRAPLRIANCSGFLGDRLSAAREIVEGGPIDFLTGDYLAELTMLILWKARAKDPNAGYAMTFLRQMEE